MADKKECFSTTEKYRPSNIGSVLLSKEQNWQLFGALGSNRTSLTAGHVKLIKITGDNEFEFLYDGVLSLTIEYDTNLCTLILFDINPIKQLWEHALHKDTKINDYSTNKQLLWFKSHEHPCVYVVCFRDIKEAGHFKLCLDIYHDFNEPTSSQNGNSFISGVTSEKEIQQLLDELKHVNWSFPGLWLENQKFSKATAKNSATSIKTKSLHTSKNGKSSDTSDKNLPSSSSKKLLEISEPIVIFNQKPTANIKPLNFGEFNDISSSSESEDEFMSNKQELAKNGICEFDRSNLKYLRKLGHGNFGIVSKHKVIDQSKTPYEYVAVKEIDKNISADIREVKNFGKCKHRHIVDFLGYFEDQKNIYIVMEFLPSDNLYECLLNYEIKFNIGQAFEMLKHIAKGMEYLHSLDIIHRDLAARNCMFSADKTCIKINDFGLSRNLYGKNYYRPGLKRCFPVVWTALECLKDAPFTKMSDVWSFGVLMWEVFSRQEPYPEIRTEHELISILSNRQRLKRPFDACSPKTYELMRSCWHTKRIKRPTFEQLLVRLQTILNEMNNSDGEIDVGKDRTNEKLVKYKTSMPVEAFYINDTNFFG